VATGRQQIRARRTRLALLDGARAVFTRQGYARSTVDDIAGVAGSSKGAVYFHFRSKEDVLLALLDGWVAGATARLLQVPTDAIASTLQHQIEALMSQEAALVLEFWAEAKTNMKVSRRLAQAERSWHRIVARQLSAGGNGSLPARDADLMAAAVLTMVRGSVALVAWATGTDAERSSTLRASVALLQGFQRGLAA
jgi:AcrR family transcriptional regulator